MGVDIGLDLRKAVEPDRVHRSVYTDPAIFELEMERIFDKVWIYAATRPRCRRSATTTTVQIGRQPMVMVRQPDGAVHVLYNRCPHRGAMLVRRPQRQHRQGLHLLLPLLELPPRRQLQRDPARQGLRGHAADAGTTPTAT